MRSSMFMIRRSSDGLYSTGGIAPRFSKTGKRWSSIHHLKAHLRNVRPDAYEGCMVAVFDVVEVSGMSCQVLRESAVTRSQAIREARQARCALEQTIRDELAELERLKKKYPHMV